jgi:hypothetical protein
MELNSHWPPVPSGKEAGRSPQSVMTRNQMRQSFHATPSSALLSRDLHVCYMCVNEFAFAYECTLDRLYGLAVRVPGYRSRGPGFDSQHYNIFWEAVGLERGPFSLVSTIEELLGRKGIGSGLENREYGRRDPLCWPRNTLYPQEFALTLPTSGSRYVGIVRLRTKGHGVFVCKSVCSVARNWFLEAFMWGTCSILHFI